MHNKREKQQQQPKTYETDFSDVNPAKRGSTVYILTKYHDISM